MTDVVLSPEVMLRMCDDLRQAREGVEAVLTERRVLMKSLVHVGEELALLRLAAVAFAHVAVSADASLRCTRTLDLLLQRCNHCRPPDSPVLKAGLRP
jgi:hypothetical protein